MVNFQLKKITYKTKISDLTKHQTNTFLIKFSRFKIKNVENTQNLPERNDLKTSNKKIGHSYLLKPRAFHFKLCFPYKK